MVQLRVLHALLPLLGSAVGAVEVAAAAAAAQDAAAAMAPASPRCSLLGEWRAGHCICDKGWAGETCSVANLKPLNTELGYHDPTSASWGGRPVEDPTTGVWSLIVSQFSNKCPLVLWTNNSRVVRAESRTGPAGPYTFAAEVYPEFHHNPSSALRATTFSPSTPAAAPRPGRAGACLS
jgi:hypothetical protein